MRSRVVQCKDVIPASVTYDKLLLDTDAPLESQTDDLDEDLFQATFPNGCVLDIGWYPSGDPSGAFGIALNQQGDYWDPFVERRCRTIPDLQKIVAELVEIAKNRPSIPQSILNVSTAWPARPYSDDLILDPMAPPGDQLGTLSENMFLAMVGRYQLRVGWSPPHSPHGRFLLSLDRSQSSSRVEGELERIEERHASSIAGMLAEFRELTIVAKKADAAEEEAPAEALTSFVWNFGVAVPNLGSRVKVMEFDHIIGASDGKMVKWMRVEESGGVIHGHPIPEEEYRKLTNVG